MNRDWHYDRIIHVEAHPHELEDHVVYNSKNLVVYFLCPCGCANTLRLPINQEFPISSWILTEIDGKPNINPSVRLSSGCKSHFTIEHGKVCWV
jgi:hypothetical protein